jgi:hypothetical protein
MDDQNRLWLVAGKNIRLSKNGLRFFFTEISRITGGILLRIRCQRMGGVLSGFGLKWAQRSPLRSWKAEGYGRYVSEDKPGMREEGVEIVMWIPTCIFHPC